MIDGRIIEDAEVEDFKYFVFSHESPSHNYVNTFSAG
jgi:hypothetical protein